MISGFVVASLEDPFSKVQLLAMALAVLGFVVWLVIPIVREVVVASIASPRRDTELKSPSITTVVRQGRRPG